MINKLKIPYLEIVFLDRNWQEVGSTESFSSLIWNTSYNYLGESEIQGGKVLFDVFRHATYAIVLEKAKAKSNQWIQTMMVEKLSISQTGGTTLVSGSMLEKILDDFVITEFAKTYRGKVGAIMHQIIRDFVVDCDEPLEKLSLGTVGLELGDVITTQLSRGDTVLEALYDLGNSHGLSFRLYYDYSADKINFEVWKGKDRTSGQTDNTFAIFEEADGQITTSSYERNESDYKNYAYVYGAGEEEERIEVTVDGRSDPKERRRAKAVDARDLQPDENAPASEYLEILKQRGKEKIAEHSIVESLTTEINPNAGLEFGKDYNLGDLCEYRDPGINLIVKQRITGVIISQTYGEYRILPEFGDHEKTYIQKLKREVR